MNLKKILGFAVGPIGSSALGLITVPIMAWLYSSEDIGRLAVLQVVMSSAILLFSLGLDQAYIRNYHSSTNKPSLLKTSFAPGLICLVVTLAIFMINPELPSKLLFSIDSTSISILVGAYFLFGLLNRFTSIVLRMQEKGLSFSMSQLLPKALLLITLGLYSIFSFGLDFYYLVIANVSSFIIASLYFLFKTKAEWRDAYKQKIDTEQIKPMLIFGLPLIISGLSYWGLTAMNTIYMRNSSTFDQLALYSVAISFASVGGVFRGIFSTVWAPTVYKWEHDGAPFSKIKDTTEQIAFIIALLFCVTALLSGVIKFILPEKYYEVQFILISCMAYPLFYTLSEATGIGTGIMRKSAHALYISILTMAINFALIFLLIPSSGASGAAISTAISSWLFFIFRTEASNYTWKKMPRIKIYITTFSCLLLSILFTLKGSEHPELFIAAWIVFSLAIVYSFRHTALNILMNTKLIKNKATH